MAVYTTIDNPGLFFNTVLYTGNGSTQSITGAGFKPDWVWIKDRTNANSHRLNDIVRGATKYLISSATSAEATESAGLTSFDSDGFSLGSNSDFNGNSANLASWNWLAGGGQGSSNTDGSINTTYTSANTTSGFSIVKYTGTGSNATVGHGLGAAPSMIIIKNLGAAQGWCIFHESMGATKFLSLNSTDASVTASDRFNDTSPTSSVFSVGTHADTNGSSATYIAYCFAEKQGYSKFGSYTGNGNANGAFVYTGFCPAWVMIKRTDTTSDWNIMDNKRAVSVNPNTKELYANSNQAEATGGQTIRDYLSNGFKLRGTSGGTNASGGTYIYMAFAENPFVTAGTKAAGTAR